MPRDFGFDEFDFGGVNRNNNINGENFDRQEFKQKLSGRFYLKDLTGDSETRPSAQKRKRNLKKRKSKPVDKSVKFEKPSALIKVNKAKEQSKKNRGLFGSILSMFHGDDTKERKMTISSRNTVEEIKEQLDKLYDRIKEYENKLESKSKEISSKLVDLSKKVSKLNREINRSQRRINIFEKQIKGYETDLNKIKDTDDFAKQTIIDGKIKGLNFKIQEERKKIRDFEDELKPLSKQKGTLEQKRSKIREGIDDLKKKEIAISQKLGRHSVPKESTFEILRRSIKENARRREIEPSQVSAGDLSFRATFNSKTYNMEYQKTRGGIPGFSGLKFQKSPQFNWIEQRLKRAEQNGFSTTPSDEDERENNKEPGGKDNPDR